MNKKFSKNWNSSKQPRKQRKFLANAPISIKKKILRVNLSKELRKKYSKRNIGLRKGDMVKILRGRFKEKKGKVIEIKIKRSKIYVEGIQVKKQDSSKVNVKLQPSNLQIIELNLEDKKRNKFLKGETSKENKTEKREKISEKTKPINSKPKKTGEEK